MLVIALCWCTTPAYYAGIVLMHTYFYKPECREDHRTQLLWLLWHMPRLHVAGDQVTAGSGFFFLHSSMFQLHVSDSLYSQVLASSQVPSGIAFNMVSFVVGGAFKMSVLLGLYLFCHDNQHY